MIYRILKNYADLMKSNISYEQRQLYTKEFRRTLRNQKNPHKEIFDALQKICESNTKRSDDLLSLWIRAAYCYPHRSYNTVLGHLLYWQIEIDFDGILDVLEEIGTEGSFSSICKAYGYKCLWFENINSVEKSLDILYQIDEEKCAYFIETLQEHKHPIVNDVAYRYYKILSGEEE